MEDDDDIEYLYEAFSDWAETGITVTLNLDWHTAFNIVGKGSLEDYEEEAIFYAIKAAVSELREASDEVKRK